MTTEVDLLADQYEIETIVRSIVDQVFHEAAAGRTAAVQSLILARVAARLVDSLVIERQAEVLRAQFTAPPAGEPTS
jgi:hypothetical protein